MIRSNVDFPQPDGPISDTNSPGSIASSMSCKRDDVALGEALRDALDLDDAHATCSGARLTTSLSATTTARKKEIPSSAAITFVAQRFCGLSE